MLKNPGGDVAYWSILWIIAGSYVAYTTFAAGRTGMGFVFAMLPVGCALIWLDIREAKWLVVAYLGIAFLGAILITLTQGFTWYLLLRGALAGYTAVAFAKWDGGPNSSK